MLQNKKENGVMSMLHEILAVDGEGEEGASSSKTSRKGPPPKLRGGATAACIALIEMISCWTEGMSVWLLSSAALLRVSDVVWVRGRQCFLEEGGIPEAAMCAMFRDAGLIAAGFLSIACMAAALSLRYHIFFALPTIKLMRGIFRPETPDVESSKHHRKRGISGTTLTTCLLMALGMVFQVWGQRAAGRSLFSSANFKERGGGYSASRTLDLILFAPVREVSPPPTPPSSSSHSPPFSQRGITLRPAGADADHDEVLDCADRRRSSTGTSSFTSQGTGPAQGAASPWEGPCSGSCTSSMPGGSGTAPHMYTCRSRAPPF